MLKKMATYLACCVLVGGVSLMARSGSKGDKLLEYKPAAD